jgi:hypothetical protein
VPKVHPTEEGLSPGSSVISPTANDVSADMNDPIWPDYDEQDFEESLLVALQAHKEMLRHMRAQQQRQPWVGHIMEPRVKF